MKIAGSSFLKLVPTVSYNVTLRFKVKYFQVVSITVFPQIVHDTYSAAMNIMRCYIT